jgi:hypothetical protein
MKADATYEEIRADIWNATLRMRATIEEIKAELRAQGVSEKQIERITQPAWKGERAAKELLEQVKAEAAKRPKLVIEDDRIVGSATVRVSESDPNYRPLGQGFVTIRYDLAEQQRTEREAEKRHMREIDPFNIGLWGPLGDA